MSTNGKLASSALKSIGNGMRLSTRTANAWLAMVAAAKRAGISIWAAYPYGAYRDLAAQTAIYKSGSHSGISVSAPGYSTHGYGTSVDVGSFGSVWGAAGAERKKWLLAHAIDFGFYLPWSESDPNHFAHNGKIVAAPVAPSTPSKTEIEGHETMTATMPVTYRDTKSGVQTWARKRSTPTGGVIERTTEKGLVGTWKTEIGCGHLTSVSANAQTILARWAAECAADKAALTKLLTGTEPNVTELATKIAAIVGVSNVEEIAEAVADELVERLGS